MEQKPDTLRKILEEYGSRLDGLDVALPPVPGHGAGAPRRRFPRPADARAYGGRRPPPAAEAPRPAREESAWKAFADAVRSGRSHRYLAAAAACAVLLAAGISIHRSMPLMRKFFSRPAKTKSIPFPASEPVSLALKNGQYISFDKQSGQLVRLDTNGPRLIARQDFPNPAAAALSFNGTCIWSVDPAHRKIYRHHSQTCAILEAYPSPGEEPSAVYWDGENLWTADRRSHKVYRHALSDGLPVLSESPVLDEEPVGLYRMGERLWVLDAAWRRIRRYRIAAPLEPDGWAPLGNFLPKGSSIAGLAVEGRWVWIMTRSPSALHRVAMRSIEFK
ncbi:MAG: hypothetical protein HY922_08570 [Elusimicrobia bacterium]|nr:hypothetical protein [Elusimicrobiota bacterium]